MTNPGITCQCEDGGKCLIHPKPKGIGVVAAGSAPEAVQNPVIDPSDKLTLKTLEAESLKAQIDAQRTQQQLIQRVQMAHQQLEQFSAAMYEKHGMKQSEWLLDLSKLEFVRRPDAK